MTLDELANWLHKFADALEPTGEDVHLAAEHQVERIKSRTAQGISYDGQPFAPKKDGSRETLEASGTMINSLHVESNADGAVIAVAPDQKAKAAALNYGTKFMPARPFMGVSDQDRIEITNDIQQSIQKRLERLK